MNNKVQEVGSGKGEPGHVSDIRSHEHDATPLSPFPRPEDSPVEKLPLTRSFAEMRRDAGSRE